MKLGEALAPNYLAETRTLWNEKLDGFSVTKFDGTATTVQCDSCRGRFESAPGWCPLPNPRMRRHARRPTHLGRRRFRRATRRLLSSTRCVLLLHARAAQNELDCLIAFMASVLIDAVVVVEGERV
jgi:hypothetical protein